VRLRRHLDRAALQAEGNKAGSEKKKLWLHTQNFQGATWERTSPWYILKHRVERNRSVLYSQDCSLCSVWQYEKK